jgi:hypothetical protein
MRNKVLLPLPLGPNKQTNSPAVTWKVTLCNAGTARTLPGKVLLTCSTVSNGVIPVSIQNLTHQGAKGTKAFFVNFAPWW